MVVVKGCSEMTMILIVDDDDETRNLMGFHLKNQGYDCSLAANATEGRQLLNEKKFKLVISDVHMPGESGLDFMQWVLADMETIGIIMTGKDSSTVRSRAREMGVHCYMIKPFHFDHLYNCVSKALGQTQLQLTGKDNLRKRADSAGKPLPAFKEARYA